MPPRSPSRIDRVSAMGAAGLTVLLLLLLARVSQLQLAPEPELAKLLQPRVTSREDLPLRGDLVDRRGRLLSATRFGYRVVVDPTLLPEPIDPVVVMLSRALGEPPEPIGDRIVRALGENERRAAQHPAAEPADKPASIREHASRLWSTLRRRFADDTPIPALPPSDAPDLAARAGHDPALDANDDAKGPIRYLPIGEIVDEDRAGAVRALRITDAKGKPHPIPGLMIERRPVREYPGGGDVADLIGKVGWEGQGIVGIEQRLNQTLAGKEGSVSFIRDAAGRPLWMEPGQVRPAQAGQDVRLSIDLELQRIATEELQRGIEDADAAGGRLVMLDPNTGEVLAMVDTVRQLPDAVPYPWIPVGTPPSPNESPTPANRPGGQRYITIQEDPARAQIPGLARNRCLEDVYEPGSTFKPFVWSTVTELGLARTDETFDTEGGRWYNTRPIEDVHKAQQMTWSEVLINSSNIGMIKGASRLTHKQLHDAVRRFGFGSPTGLFQLTPSAGLGGEASGLVTKLKDWSTYTQVSVAFGYEIAVTPVQMARAFSVFARSGERAGTLPAIRLTAHQPNAIAPVLYRVLPKDIAVLTRRTMRGVAANMELRMAEKNSTESNWRYPIFGKSGTAEIPLTTPPKGFRRPKGAAAGYFDGQYNCSFIAGGPVEEPRLVVVVVIDDPGPARVRARSHYGAQTAGPVVRRVMERALTYLGVPPEPDPEPVLATSDNAPAGLPTGR